MLTTKQLTAETTLSANLTRTHAHTEKTLDDYLQMSKTQLNTYLCVLNYLITKKMHTTLYTTFCSPPPAVASVM